MRIALRTSGGRGEYEISGSHAGITASQIINYSIAIQIIPGNTLETHNVVKIPSGQAKPRIRRSNENARHLYLTLADIFLLPKPKREIGSTPGGKLQLTDNNFSVTSIDFDILEQETATHILYIRPTKLTLSNSDNSSSVLDVIDRMRLILNVWDCLDQIDSGDLKDLVAKHRLAFYSNSDGQISQAAKNIRTFLVKNCRDVGDPLRQLVHLLKIDDDETLWMGLRPANEADDFSEDDPTGILIASRRSVMQWRLAASRGYSARKFADNVKQAYCHTCLFSGNFLPKTSMTESPGVDSAHILPWATHNLNGVDNGICLDKLCHWAFDNGILRLDFDVAENSYLLSIPENYLTIDREKRIDLSAFHRFTGKIPQERLPKNQNLWPNPIFLENFNKVMALV